MSDHLKTLMEGMTENMKSTYGISEAKEKGKTLKIADLKYGNIIQSKKNPEWGTWVIKDRTDYKKDWWVDIQGDRGSRTLAPSEAEDWILVKKITKKDK